MSETDLMWLFIIINTFINALVLASICILSKEGSDKE